MGIIDRLTKKNEEKKIPSASKERKVKAAPKTDDVKKESVATPSLPIKGNAMGGVLVKAYMSEKAAIGEAKGAYTFLVQKDASKLAIKKAVEQIYGILPTDVRIMNTEGKRLRFGRSFGKRTDMKKAIVKLPKGKSISIHEGV